MTDQQAGDLATALAGVMHDAHKESWASYAEMARAVLASGLVIPHAPLQVWIAKHQAEGFCDKSHADALEHYIATIQAGEDYDWEDE